MRIRVHQKRTHGSCLYQPSLSGGEMVNELGKLYEVGTPNMQQEHDTGEGRMKQGRDSRNGHPEDPFAGRGLPLGIASQRMGLYLNG